jgi:hypothetical protein
LVWGRWKLRFCPENRGIEMVRTWMGTSTNKNFFFWDAATF